MITHAPPNPATLTPLRRGPLCSRHQESGAATHGKWLFAALVTLLLAAVVIGAML